MCSKALVQFIYIYHDNSKSDAKIVVPCELKDSYIGRDDSITNRHPSQCARGDPQQEREGPRFQSAMAHGLILSCDNKV